MDRSRDRYRGFLLGDDRKDSGRWVVVAVGLFLVVDAIYRFGAYRPIYAAVPGMVIVGGGALLLAAIAAWQAYSNRGLLVSVLLGVAPVVPLVFRIVAAGQTSDPTLLTVLVRGTAFGMLFGVPIGAVGFGVGYGVRTLRNDDGR